MSMTDEIIDRVNFIVEKQKYRDEFLFIRMNGTHIPVNVDNKEEEE